MEWLRTGLLVIVALGGGLGLFNFFRGLDLWRRGTARTEARGIANLEAWRAEADHRAEVRQHRLEYYRDELGPYKDRRIAMLEGVIIRRLGEDALPPEEPRPVMAPLPKGPAPIQLDEGKGDDAPAERD